MFAKICLTLALTTHFVFASENDCEAKTRRRRPFLPRFATAMEKRNMSVETIAHHMKMPVRDVRNLLTGYRHIGIIKSYELADILVVEVDEVLSARLMENRQELRFLDRALPIYVDESKSIRSELDFSLANVRLARVILRDRDPDPSKTVEQAEVALEIARDIGPLPINRSDMSALVARYFVKAVK